MCFYVFFQVVSWYSHLTSLYLTIFPHTQTSEAHRNEAVGLEAQPHHLCGSHLLEARVFFGEDGLDSKDSKSGFHQENFLGDLMWNSYVTEVLDLF